MSLQLVMGSSGSGKSHLIYQKIIAESEKNQDITYMIIVPEQFTMQTQKDIVAMHPRKGILNIDVLSFLRLANRVFDETGGNDRLILEDTGKSMVLRKIMARESERLGYLKANVKKKGFIDEVKSLLSELFQYDIGEEQLKQMISFSKTKPVLKEKLQDILFIYQSFIKFMEEKYIAEEEILDLLCDAVDNSKKLADCIICFDGFTGFTPAQYKVLKKLMKLCPKIYITVTIDLRENLSEKDEEFRLFHLSRITINKLMQTAKDVDVPIEEHRKAGEKEIYRFADSPALKALEKNLFRYPFACYKEEQDDIRIFSAKNPLDEVDFTVKEILRLTREENYRYRDIAIVTGSIDDYGKDFEKRLTEAGIPCFLDQKKSVMGNPAVELVRSVLEVIEDNFSYDSVFRCLKCGMIELEKEEIDVLENYVLACGIRGYSSWAKEWIKTYNGTGEADLEKINSLREYILGLFLPVKKVFQKQEKNVLDMTAALYKLLAALRVQEKLEKDRIKFERSGEMLLEKEYKQMYRVLIGLFDQIVDLIGDEVLTTSEYREVLETGLEEIKVGLIPPGIDQIVVGDMERTRLKDIKALFFSGVNDGIIPKYGGGTGIISDTEREWLADGNIELAPTKRQNVYTERFYLYLTMTKPKNKLYITFSKTNSEGKMMRPSYLIRKVLGIFPKLKIEEEEKDMLRKVIAADKGKRYLIRGLRESRNKESEVEWKELFSLYWMNEEKQKALKTLVEGAFYQKPERGISKIVAGMLYGNRFTAGVTRMEQYAACAFSHFLKYGLELKAREEFQLAAPDLGNIFHNVMERYSGKLAESGYNWHTVSRKMQEQLAEESVDEIAGDYGNLVLFSSKRSEYMIDRVKRMTKRTIWAVSEQIKRGEFEPEGFELKFSYFDDFDSVHIPLGDKNSMYLTGRIDRLDTCEQEDRLYVKVVDYKTGQVDFDIVSMYYGLQLQLAVYLNASIELEHRKHPDKQIIPAGIFYYHIDDPVVEKQERKEQIERALLKQLKMNGLVNQDMKIAALIDRGLAGEDGSGQPSVKSDIIPVETGKDGIPSKRSSVAKTEQFLTMLNFAEQKLNQLGKEMITGNTDVNPYKLAGRTACDYCEFKDICGFDLKMQGYGYRNLKQSDAEEIFDKMAGKKEEDALWEK